MSEYFIAGLKSQMRDIRKKGRSLLAAANILKKPEISELYEGQQQIVKHIVIHERVDNKKAQEI